MILERSTGYWSVGITLTWHPEGGCDASGNRVDAWSGSADYCDDGWLGDDNPDAGKISTEGTLRTRYRIVDGEQQTALSAIVDALIADGKRLGIHFGTADGGKPRLYVPGDGEWEDSPVPAGWRELLAVEARRVGWETYSVPATA